MSGFGRVSPGGGYEGCAGRVADAWAFDRDLRALGVWHDMGGAGLAAFGSGLRDAGGGDALFAVS